MKILNGREFVPVILSVIALLIGTRMSPFFLDPKYLYNHTSLFVETGVLAVGMTLVILLGQIDLSVGSTLGLVAAATAISVQKGLPIPLAVVLGILLGGFLGFVNGMMIGRFRLPSFVVTLGTMAAYRGIAQVLLRAKSVTFPMLSLAKPPVSAETIFLFTFLFAALLFAIILHKTIFGRWIYSIGSNYRASYFSGLPTDRVTIIVYILSGALAGMGGIMMNTRLGLARQDYGVGLELDAITAVVLGGTSIYGGNGTMAGTLVALGLLGIVRTEMGVANIVPEYQLAVIGSLLVGSILIGNLLDPLTAKLRSHRAARTTSTG